MLGAMRFLLTLAVLAAATSAQAAPDDAPPTGVVDLAAFARHDAARFATAGPELHVAPAGDDGAAGSARAPLRTLRAALARAVTGTRVVVRAGEYREGSDDDDWALRLETDGVVVTTPDGERATVRPPGPGVRSGLLVRASRVAWRGVSFDGFAACGVAIGVDGRTLDDVVLADLDVRMAGGGDGIAVHQDPGPDGPPVVRGLTLARATIKNADLGFTVGSGPVKDLLLVDVLVENARVNDTSSGADAIAVERGDHVLLWRVEVSGAAADGIDLKATRVAVVDAWVHDVARNGIKLWFGGDIVNALVTDAGADAAIVLGGERPGARYRLVHVGVGFHLRGAGERAYAMTVAYDEPTTPVTLDLLGCWFAGNAGPVCLSRGTRLTARACLFGPGPGGAVLEHAWDGETSSSVWATEAPAALSRAGAAADNLPFRTDPGLVDPAARTRDGWRPRPRSPLVGRGPIGRGLPANDLAGAPRGRRSAIGPLQP